jgi:1,3,6,8-tetrahydroxynaphthalene synthase
VQTAVCVPEHVITMEETLELARSRHADHPRPQLALRLIENTGVRTRHIVRPIEETLRHPGFEERNKVYEAEAKARVPAVVQRAPEDAELLAADIDVIIYVSCTGFMMPSLTAWLINSTEFSSDTRQIPMAQLGCAADGTAINRAHDFCTAHPEAKRPHRGLRVLLAVLPADRPRRWSVDAAARASAWSATVRT